MATTEKSPSMKLVKTATVAKPAKPAPAPKAEVEETTGVEAAEVETQEATAPASDDMIVKTAYEIDHMKQAKAFDLVPNLLDNIDHDYFKLGGVLAKVQAEGWFMEKGHETFRSYVEADCGIQYRKAMYLIQIYNGLVGSGVAWDKVKHLGWSKLKELANILDADNVDAWVEIALNMTVIQLQEHIKESTKGESAGSSTEVAEKTTATTTMTFKLHADQKTTVREALDKVKHQSGTEVDSAALEFMALDFLGGNSTLKAMPTLEELMKTKSMEEVLEAFDKVFPNVTVEVTVTG